jgi:hypothetical protein
LENLKGSDQLEQTGVMVDNIRMDLGEKGSESVDWINLAQEKYQCRNLVKTIVYHRVP